MGIFHGQATCLEEWRCSNCRTLLARQLILIGTVEIKCRCNTLNVRQGADPAAVAQLVESVALQSGRTKGG